MHQSCPFWKHAHTYSVVTIHTFLPYDWQSPCRTLMFGNAVLPMVPNATTRLLREGGKAKENEMTTPVHRNHFFGLKEKRTKRNELLPKDLILSVAHLVRLHSWQSPNPICAVFTVCVYFCLRSIERYEFPCHARSSDRS